MVHDSQDNQDPVKAWEIGVPSQNTCTFKMLSMTLPLSQIMAHLYISYLDNGSNMTLDFVE